MPPRLAGEGWGEVFCDGGVVVMPPHPGLLPGGEGDCPLSLQERVGVRCHRKIRARLTNPTQPQRPLQRKLINRNPGGIRRDIAQAE